jgi:hypothetical protein
MRRAKEDAPLATEEDAPNNWSPRGADMTAARTPPRRGYELYVDDLFAAGMGLVKAAFELDTMSRYEMADEVAAAVAEMAATTSELVALLKWTQDRLRRIDWNQRPQVRPVPEVPTLTLLRGDVR